MLRPPRCDPRQLHPSRTLSFLLNRLRRAGESRERRRQATHPATVKPELVAAAPNAVWSWDITKLRGPAKWTYYYLYVILDVHLHLDGDTWAACILHHQSYSIGPIVLIRRVSTAVELRTTLKWDMSAT